MLEIFIIYIHFSCNKKEIMHPVDDGAKNNITHAGHEPNESGNDDHPGILTGHEFIEVYVHCFSGIGQPMAAAWVRKKLSVIPAMKSQVMAAGGWVAR